MAYQTSTTIASNQLLIDAIASFAVAAGWTQERNVLTGANRVVTLRKPGTSDYVHIFNTNTSEIRMRASVGYDAGATISLQPNVSPADTIVNALVGPYPTVWMFAEGDNVHIVVRRSDITGGYAHVLFGVLSKYGAWDGGTYVDGTYFNTSGSSTGTWGVDDHAPFGYGYSTTSGYVRCDADGAVNKWWATSGNGSGAHAWAGVGALSLANMYSANQASPTYDISRWVNAADDNTFSGRSFFHVIDLMVPRAGTPLYCSPIGYPWNLRLASLAKFDPEQEVSVAGETWTVFPIARKAAPSGASGAPIGTDNLGFAIRKVA